MRTEFATETHRDFETVDHVTLTSCTCVPFLELLVNVN